MKNKTRFKKVYIAFCNLNLDTKINMRRVNLCCIILPNMSINVKWEID